MNAADQEFIFILVLWAIGAIISLWVTWAIIRSAVLSALRKHAREQRAEAQQQV